MRYYFKVIQFNTPSINKQCGSVKRIILFMSDEAFIKIQIETRRVLHLDTHSVQHIKLGHNRETKTNI